MATAVQDALADVAFRLESLKAALSERDMGADGQAGQLMAIKRVQHELEALLQPKAAATASTAADHEPRAAAAPAAEAGLDATAPKPAGLPATPFEQRRAPAAGPATATKAPAPTPGGLPATTPLAAEVLASLNALGSSSGVAAARAEAAAVPARAATASSTLDPADGAAAATLSGFLGGLEPRQPGVAAQQATQQAAQRQQQQQQDQQQQDGQLPALASLLQEAALAPPPPTHAAAMAAAAAAAAGPALPVSRRQSAVAAALLPLPGAQQREQRPCNCKRSMCLKMYCECFAAGGFCAPCCSCLNCSNTPADVAAVQAARDVVLAKNPRAFDVKVTAAEGHKRGCRCKRSKCLKKYCECFHAGARCNPDVCQCEDCRNTDGDALLMPVLAKHAPSQGWADASADVLAMFQQPLPLPAADSLSDGSGGARRGRAQQLPPPPLPLSLPPAAGFSFAGLPPLPEPAAFNPVATAAAAAVFGALQPSAAGMFAAPPPLPPAAYDPAAAAAFMLNPVAAAAAATFAAAATLAEQQQQAVEESMADAVSFPAAAAPVRAAAQQAPSVSVGTGAATPKVASALTSHLSDMAAMADSEMHDTATSPAPHMAMAKLAAAQRNLAAATAAATLTGGAGVALGRPPLPGSRVRSRANSGDSQLSQGSADENGGASFNMGATAGQRKRPRRAASGGVLGAVAAEACQWGLEMVSPPLKRANSLPAGLEQQQPGKPGGGRAKVSDRVALLKKALVAETAAAAAAAGAPCLPRAAAALLVGPDAPTAEDEDAISALFELSASQ
ncbi:hypothetical protein ABPG75_012620 [Micractinium tetrahymenae]